MSKRAELCLAVLVAATQPAAAQDTPLEFRPTVDVYVNQGSRTRILFQYSLNENRPARDSRGHFAYYLEFALRPVLRRELRRREDVFRKRYLTFRAGYQYTTSLTNGNASSEKRSIAELTAQYPLPGGFAIRDRSRGDFRFVNGQPFSARYRNRLWLDRDLKFRGLVFTPYAYDEIYFDTRYDAWSSNRIALGLQIPAGPHVVAEPYFQQQVNSRSTPRVIDALGLKFSLYF
jgi:uncharacterized protein DUF2490